MSRLTSVIPELAALESRQQLIRIPPELDIPVTERVKALIDTATFRRLARISQLGLVGLVYPAAHHSRLEHSLGVYHTALLFLQRLQHDKRFAQQVDAHAAEVFLVAALLHDIGHWPFCHPIEDMQLPNVPAHEAFAAKVLRKVKLQTSCCSCGTSPGRRLPRCYGARPWGITTRYSTACSPGRSTSTSWTI